MSRIRKYREFINENIFSRALKNKEKTMDKGSDTNKVDRCIINILAFLKSNDVKDWNDFCSMTTFDREVVDKLIDSEVDNMSQLKDVRFGVKIQLSDKPQLQKMLKEYEKTEEYEKCEKILKKIKNL